MEPSAEPDIIKEFLSDAGVPAELLAQASDPVLEDGILSELETISKELPAGDIGGTRVIIGGRHINLGETGWKLLTSLTALAISTLDPTGLTRIVVLKEGLDLLKE